MLKKPGMNLPQHRRVASLIQEQYTQLATLRECIDSLYPRESKVLSRIEMGLKYLGELRELLDKELVAKSDLARKSPEERDDILSTYVRITSEGIREAFLEDWFSDTQVEVTA